MTKTTAIRPAALFAVAAFIGLLAPEAAQAQGVTSAAVNGRVTGQDMAPLGAAVVTAVHGPSGTAYSTLSREDGRFNIPGMRVGGPYSVSVSLIGHRDESAEGLVLALGENRRVDFVLAVEAVDIGEITVTAERGAILSAGRTGPQQTVTTREIENMPTISRSIQDFARLTPQALGSNIGSSENIGGISIGGKNNRFNNISVDGAILNDVFGLPASGTPGGQANSQPISLDAVQEFQVAIAPFDVRQGGFTGGSINVVTRSGTNNFDASGYAFGRNQGFTGKLDDNPLTDFSELQAGFRAGGPIQRDRIHFFTSGEIKQTSRPLALGLLGSSQTNTIDVDLATINEIVDIANSVYNYEPGRFEESLQRETDDLKFFARLDFNLSDNNHLIVRHNHVNANSQRGISRHSGEVGLPGQGYTFDAVSNSTVIQLDSRLGSAAANMFRVSYQRQRDARTPDLAIWPEVDIEPYDGESESVTMGIERFSQQNALDQDVFEITNDLTLFRGGPYAHLWHAQRVLFLLQPVHPGRVRAVGVRWRERARQFPQRDGDTVSGVDLSALRSVPAGGLGRHAVRRLRPGSDRPQRPLQRHARAARRHHGDARCAAGEPELPRRLRTAYERRAERQCHVVAAAWVQRRP